MVKVVSLIEIWGVPKTMNLACVRRTYERILQCISFGPSPAPIV